jgi:polynucleotide 5'-kinase involved in rRNA processing
MRSHYRAEKVREYFKGGRMIEISSERIGIRFPGGPTGFRPQDLTDRIVSFRDEDNRDVALGIIEDVTAGGTVFLIRTPIADGARISAIVVGKTVFDRTNRELRDSISQKR